MHARLLLPALLLLSALPGQAGELPFGAAQPVFTNGAAGAPTLADIDGDGDLDALGTDAAGLPVWYPNLGSSWGAAVPIDDIAATPVTAGDYDGDGDADVIAEGFELYTNDDGLGTDWGDPTPLVANGAEDGRLLDVDGDGDLDLVYHDSLFLRWLRNGDAQVFVIVSGGNRYGWDAGDVDRDGDLDFVTTDAQNPVEWHENQVGDGSQWQASTIASDPFPRDAVVADIDGDGDPDVAAAFGGSDPIWYANDGSGGGWAQTVLTGAGASGQLLPADLDRDGDVDLLLEQGSSIGWNENVDGAGGSWTQHVVGSGPSELLFVSDLDRDGDPEVLGADVPGRLEAFDNETIHRSAHFPELQVTGVGGGGGPISVADLDRDGDLDAIVRTSSAPMTPDPLRWMENLSGDGTTWTEHVIMGGTGSPARDAVADLDGDGDLDVANALFDDTDSFAWHENLDGLGTSWSTTVLPPVGIGASEREIAAADLDGDGDVDLVGAIENDLDVVWFENANGDFSNPILRTIDGSAFSNGLTTGDLDGDGDVDVISGGGGNLRWHENLGGTPLSWTTHTIITSAGSIRQLIASDADADGDLDIFSVNVSEGVLRLHGNLAGNGSTWSDVVVSDQCMTALYLAVADLDGDGDPDAACGHDGALGTDPALLHWFANDGQGGGWTPVAVQTDPLNLTPGGMAAGDFDGDGDDDLMHAWRQGGGGVTWYPNHGGQLALPTTDVAYQGMVDGQRRQVLEVEATHAGRSGDSDIALTQLQLLLTDDLGAPLDSAEASALLTSIELRDGDPDGALLGSGAPAPDANGVHGIVQTSSVIIAQGSPRQLVVVVTLSATASSASPNAFEVALLSRDTSTATDASSGVPVALTLETATGSGAILALPVAGDHDGDGLQNSDEADVHLTDPADADTDDDGLADGDEVGGASDPLDADSDDDGLLDGEEVDFYATSPVNPDSDGDGYCDGPQNPGGACAQGAGDNCPAVDNASQANSDVFAAGDACQCGDVDDSGAIGPADALLARQHLVSRGPAGFFAERCNVVGPSDGGTTDCDVADVALLERAAVGADAAIGNLCEAYRGP